uniref:Uncharacterized protein n=1 Tax=Romanomermis culicivorax TaxID=13658 RepID=A0A915IIX4_ROMCU
HVRKAGTCDVLSESEDTVQICQETEHCGTNTISCEEATSSQELKRMHLEEEHDFKMELMKKEEEDRQSLQNLWMTAA